MSEVEWWLADPVDAPWPAWATVAGPCALDDGAHPGWLFEADRAVADRGWGAWLDRPEPGPRAYWAGALDGYRLGVEHGARALALLDDASLREVARGVQAEVDRRSEQAAPPPRPRRPSLPGLRERR